MRPDINEREVEDGEKFSRRSLISHSLVSPHGRLCCNAPRLTLTEFRRFGKIAKIWIARKPPGFAFIDYEVRLLSSLCVTMRRHVALRPSSAHRRAGLSRRRGRRAQAGR